MSLIRVLQSELRLLSEESRKKYPQIKDAADRGIRQLRSIQEKVDDDNVNQSKVVKTNEEIIKPFLLACESKATKLIVISLSSLQQLLLHSAVPIGGLNIIVETVARLSDQNSEEAVQLKILQLALTVFTSDQYELSQTTLAKLLRICFQLHSSKSANVYYTATAAIRQAIAVLFDKLGQKIREAKGSDGSSIATTSNGQELSNDTSKDLFNYSKNLYLLLQDLCSFVEGNAGTWFNVSNVSNAFALELIDTLLNTHSDLLVQNSQLVQVIDQKVYPFVSNYIYSASINSLDPAFVMKTYRISSSIIQHYYSVMHARCQDLIQRICNVFNVEYPLCYKLAAFEVFKNIAQNEKAFKLLFEELSTHKNAAKDQSNALIDLITSMSNSVQKMVRQYPGITFNLQQYMKKENRLDIFIEKGVPQITVEECLASSIECIMVVVTSTSVLAGIHTPGNHQEVSAQENEGIIYFRELASHLIENIWCPVLAALSLLLEQCEEEETIQLILRTYLLFTHTCGVTGLAVPRDAFLTSLCKFTPQVSGIQLLSPITRKNIQVIKILFNFAHCLGGLLGSSWYLLLKNFQVFESIMNRENFKGELEEDLKILNAALNNLFKSTEHLDPESLIIVLKSLCSLSKDTLKNAAPNEPPRLFGAMKLVETVRTNAHRADLIWRYFSAHILFLIEHSDEDVRKFGVESAANAIRSIIKPEYDKAMTESKHIDPSLEQNVFSIFPLIFDSKYKDVKERVLHAINNLIQKCGQLLSSSWSIILPILASCCEELDSETSKPPLDSKYISIAFKGVNCIGNQFLSCLPSDSLLYYIETVGAYSKQERSADVNINLVAINIFMNIADYLAAEKNQVVLWSKLFEQLVKATIDNRPEVRHASLRTLAFCMTSCGDKFNKDAWDTFISQALFPILYDINEEASKAEANPNVPVATETSGDSSRRKQVQIMVHHSRNTAAKQWSETRSLTIENISRVIKEHGSKDLSKAEMFEELCTKFIDFLHQSVQTKTTEITKSTARYLQEMLLTCTDPALKIIWKGAWLIWETIADFALNQDMSDANTITFLADGLLELYNSRKDIFSQEDINHVIQLAHKFIVCPAAMNVIILPSTIQKTCLLLITTVCHYSDETYDQVFKELASILPSKSSIEKQLQTQERERFMKSSNLPPPKTLQPPVKLAIAAQKDLVECVMNAPDTVQKRLYHHLVNVLGTMMLTKYVIFTRADPNIKSMTGSPPFFYPLWKSTIKLFESVISNSSKHFDKESEIDTVNNMWFDFCQAVETFLFPASSDLINEYEEKIKKIDKSDSEDSETDEELGVEDEEMQLIRLIEKYALPHCQSASGDVKKRILSILERATHNSPKLIAAESLKCIFRLIKEATDACIKKEQNKELADTNIDHLIEIGQYLIPMTLSRCKEILKAFLKEDQRTGLMPLPRYRREEVLNVLNELSSVEVHPLLFGKCQQQQQQQMDDKPRISSSVLSGPKGLIIRLFPILCDFVATTDNSIKMVLMQMFKIVSAELGLSEE